MNKQQILLTNSFILILILIIFTQYSENFHEGKITKIESSVTRTIINLENSEIDFVSFNQIENIEDCKTVKISGRDEIYKNKKKVIIDKIICLK